MIRLVLLAVAALQAATAQPAFEAASVRPTPPNDSCRPQFRFLPGGGVSVVGPPHRQTRMGPIHTLSIAKEGLKLEPSALTDAT